MEAQAAGTARGNPLGRPGILRSVEGEGGEFDLVSLGEIHEDGGPDPSELQDGLLRARALDTNPRLRTQGLMDRVEPLRERHRVPGFRSADGVLDGGGVPARHDQGLRLGGDSSGRGNRELEEKEQTKVGESADSEDPGASEDPRRRSRHRSSPCPPEEPPLPSLADGPGPRTPSVGEAWGGVKEGCGQESDAREREG